MPKPSTLLTLAVGVLCFIVLALLSYSPSSIPTEAPSQTTLSAATEEPLDALDIPHAMSIEALRQRTYPGSILTIEETLSSGTNYHRYIASYLSDDLKIYGLLTAPFETPPEAGFPTIVFLHGYIPPNEYVTTVGYQASQDGLARSGFVTFKPDFRGHGRSEGEATSAHFSEAYVVDTLNAVASLQQYTAVDPQRIGIWGHSNGGEIGLRSLVISPSIKAAVFWAGVVGSFEDMLETYQPRIPFMRSTPQLVEEYGFPSTNPTFWNQIDPYAHLRNLSVPLQLHHGTQDAQVPVELSRHLNEELTRLNKDVELHEYPGADHNLNGQAFGIAMRRTIDFFTKEL